MRSIRVHPGEEIAEAFKVLRESFEAQEQINNDVRPTTRVASIRLAPDGRGELVGLPWMWRHEKYAHCNAKRENVARYPAYLDNLRPSPLPGARQRVLRVVTHSGRWEA
jgi:hypothetical protein